MFSSLDIAHHGNLDEHTNNSLEGLQFGFPFILSHNYAEAYDQPFYQTERGDGRIRSPGKTAPEIVDEPLAPLGEVWEHLSTRSSSEAFNIIVEDCCLRCRG